MLIESPKLSKLWIPDARMRASTALIVSRRKEQIKCVGTEIVYLKTLHLW